MHFLACQGKDFEEGLRPIEEEEDEQDGEISLSSIRNLSGFTIVDILTNVGAKVSSFLSTKIPCLNCTLSLHDESLKTLQ